MAETHQTERPQYRIGLITLQKKKEEKDSCMREMKAIVKDLGPRLKVKGMDLCADDSVFGREQGITAESGGRD